MSDKGKLATWALFVAMCGSVVPPAATGQPVDLQALEDAFVALVREVSPSVVSLEVRYAFEDSWEFGVPRVSMAGSGVVVDPGGLILTNDHVVRGGDHIRVVLHNGERYDATVVGSDDRSDLAVIAIDANHLVPAVWGDVDEVEVGQFAFAMGNAFGVGGDGKGSFSYGVVSALGRSLRSLEEGGRRYYGNLIQTTADINPGNSGGPLFNIHGQLIGINTAIESASGASDHLGYAIPLSARTKKIIRKLARGVPIIYGFLGIRIVDADQDTLRRSGRPRRGPWGVVVAEVMPDTPAQAADIRPRDLILQYASEPVRGADHFVRMVGATPVGERVSMLVYRDRREMLIEATITERR